MLDLLIEISFMPFYKRLPPNSGLGNNYFSISMSQGRSFYKMPQTKWMPQSTECPLVFTRSSEPACSVEGKRNGKEEEEEKEEEKTDYFPVSLQKESMRKARGRLFWSFPMSVVFTVRIIAKYIYSLPGVELSTLHTLALSIFTTILWVVAIIIPF